MSESLSNGSVYAIAATYGPVIPVTGISNAAPPVASAVGHGLVAGDIVEVTSGWGGLNNRMARIASPTADAFTLEAMDTTSTLRYSIGGGAGSVRKVLTWVEVAQITDAASSGGEQQYVQWVYLADGNQRQKRTYKNAKSLKLTLNDDPALPCYPILRAADVDGINRAIRLVLPTAGAIYYNMDVSFDDEPKLNSNQIMQVEATMSQVAKFIRYDA